MIPSVWSRIRRVQWLLCLRQSAATALVSTSSTLSEKSLTQRRKSLFRRVQAATSPVKTTMIHIDRAEDEDKERPHLFPSSLHPSDRWNWGAFTILHWSINGDEVNEIHHLPLFSLIECGLTMENWWKICNVCNLAMILSEGSTLNNELFLDSMMSDSGTNDVDVKGASLSLFYHTSDQDTNFDQFKSSPYECTHTLSL